MKVQEFRITLTVDDFDKAMKFYGRTLGLESVESWHRPNGRGVILALPSAPLELFDQAQAETVDSIEVGKRVSGQIRFAVQVNDVEKTSAELEKAGATIVNAAVRTPWGDKNQRLQTPGGLQSAPFQAKGKS